ncbi:hypothetical protein ACFOD4_08095 [Pseudoroseomonas globiformis]|uniref:Uncharacterized protein n=1 Tax=Teichococcus globiformis TaxID=2307229 RepID=A0ABV7G0F6_9PROT
MTNPVVNGFLLALMGFAVGAALLGVMLERATRCPGALAGVVVVAMIGLSWGGAVLLAQ